MPSPLTESQLVILLREAGCVFAEDEARVLLESAATPDDLAGMAARRSSGLPLEHVVGWASFFGHRIAVDPGVFVPRRRTEALVAAAIDLLHPGAVAVDLCCGSGAVAVALASAGIDLEVHAADIDPAAVRCARRNVEPIGGAVHEGDLFGPMPVALAGRIHVLTANTPYVPTAAVASLPTEARLHEALIALDGGIDGLDVQRRVADGASRWLAPGGHVLVESSEEQSAVSAAILRSAGLVARIVERDELDAFVVVGTRPA